MIKQQYRDVDTVRMAAEVRARMNKYTATQRRALGVLAMAAIRHMTLSRSYKWQLKMMAQGRCRSCARKTTYGQRCKSCTDQQRTARRNYYRRKVGIPMDAPLSASGRPRK